MKVHSLVIRIFVDLGVKCLVSHHVKVSQLALTISWSEFSYQCSISSVVVLLELNNIQCPLCTFKESYLPDPVPLPISHYMQRGWVSSPIKTLYLVFVYLSACIVPSIIRGQ